MAVPLRNFAASLLCSLTAFPAEENPPAIALPAEFELPSPPVPGTENGIVLFLREFEVPKAEEMKRYRDSLDTVKSGTRISDPQLLDEFRQTHDLGKKWLKPPLFFPETEPGQTNYAAFLRLYYATEILTRQNLLKGDRGAADRYLADAFLWSKLLRNAQPTLLEGLMAQFGWRWGIGMLLEDWQSCEEQRKRLDELIPVFNANRHEIEELVASVKTDARWWARQGGTRAILENMVSVNISKAMLNDRFQHLTRSDLLSLPYDLEAEAKRHFDVASGWIRGLRQDIPAVKWPGISRPIVNRTIEDYRKRPNGLGDLMSEQARNSIIDPPWIQGLRRQRLLDTCLLWLKRERNGLDVTAGSFKELTDPLSGEALDIDLENRLIRCRGWDGKAAPLDTDELKPGFHDEQDDFLLVVPRWKERK